MEANTARALQGGGFLINPSTTENTFTPEDFSEEQKLTADTCREFLQKEVLPLLPDIERRK